MEFKQGQKLLTIYLTEGHQFNVGENCDSIEVVMELGNGSHMPWFAVIKDGNVISKWNAAMVEGVNVT